MTEVPGMPEEGSRVDLQYATIPALLRSVAQDRSDAEVVVDHSCEPVMRMSYAELLDRVNKLAAALISEGVQKGDRIAIWAPNCWEWIVALLGLQSAGAVLVPLNTRYKGLEAADILRRSHARMLFTVEGFLGNEYVSMLRATEGDLPALERIVLLRDAGISPAETCTLDQFIAEHEETADQAAVTERVAQISGEDLSDLLFTSGTTGQPKGVMLTHAQNLREHLCSSRTSDDLSKLAQSSGV